MVNSKNNNKKTTVGHSTSCTSFGTCKQISLSNFKPPSELTLAMKNYLVENFRGSPLCNNYIKLINNLSNIKRIEPKHYFTLFKILLYLEEHELMKLIAKYNLKDYHLQHISDKFAIVVPTLSEDDPFICIGNTVKLYIQSSKHTYFCKIIDIVEKTIFVSPVSKSTNKLINETVDVHFISENWPIKCCHYVLHFMFRYNLINLIYPKINKNVYALPEENLDWVHKSVAENPEQKTAIRNILNSSAYPAPYILFGPPGTGKTTTLVEAICQIRKQHKTKNILVCASSNAAADEIAKRLLLVHPPKDIFRMYAASKQWSSIDKSINPSSNFIDKTVLYLPKEIFILKKIVITTLVTSIRLVTLKLQNDHFSYIFIDEASQSTELESLIPLTIMSTKNKTKEAVHAQIIISGDPHQLGPTIRCKQIKHLLGKSLLERLMESEPYQRVDGKYDSRYIMKLIRNYRSQEPILYASNKLFYDGELLCCQKSKTHIISNWSTLSKRTFPILFFTVKGTEVRMPDMSVYNEKEVTVIIYCTLKLMKSTFGNRKIKQEDIGIVTPFKQQKIKIENKLKEHNLNDITVGTVETFQGQEKEIILLTTVRSHSFEHDGKEHIGFLSNPKRFNVALTRAKNMLIVVGNPSVLCKDKYWNTLLQYCMENNACVTY